MQTRAALFLCVLLGACGAPDEDDIATTKSALESPPAVEGIEFLQAAGIDTTNLFQKQDRQYCNVYLHTTGSDTQETTVTCATPPGFLIDDVPRLNVIESNKCSYSLNFIAGGTDFTMLEEIDRTYGRAIDLAVSAGKIDVSVKIGQMRDYAKHAYQVRSATDVWKLWARAKSRWIESSGATCNLELWGTFVKM